MILKVSSDDILCLSINFMINFIITEIKYYFTHSYYITLPTANQETKNQFLFFLKQNFQN